MIKILINKPFFFIRSNNSDWNYFSMLNQINETNPNISFIDKSDFFFSLLYNFKYLLHALSRKFKFYVPIFLKDYRTLYLPKYLIKKHSPNCLYFYDKTTRTCYEIPIVFHTGFNDPSKLNLRGETEKNSNYLENQKHITCKTATIIMVNTNWAAKMLGEKWPDINHKIRVSPFFIPHITPISENIVKKKFHEYTEINLLFIGREAKRKNLKLVIDIFFELLRSTNISIHLTIVSDFKDGKIEIPKHKNIRHFKKTSRVVTNKLMEESHIFIMPSLYESYGWVYIEAMSKGCIVIANSDPTQVEILNNGKCGINIPLNKEEALKKILPYLKSKNLALDLAIKGLNHCVQNYTPKATSECLNNLFNEAIKIHKNIKQ